MRNAAMMVLTIICLGGDLYALKFFEFLIQKGRKCPVRPDHDNLNRLISKNRPERHIPSPQHLLRRPKRPCLGRNTASIELEQ